MKEGVFIQRCSVENREAFQKASTIFQQHGGLLKATDALRAGIHPRTLYAILSFMNYTILS
jgi:hypothetical protein